MASTRSTAARSTAAPARAALRSTAKRRKRARPPQPQMPRDFFDADTYRLLNDLLIERAVSWRKDWLAPVYYYPRDSAPRWDETARQRISGATLRSGSRKLLVDCFSIDLEQALRLLTLPWNEETGCLDGHTPEDWHAGLAGAFWRIGQLYRESVRRCGVEETRKFLVQLMDSLWK